MASHNSTPQSILDAPTGTRTYVEGTEHTHLGRAQRRKLFGTRPGEFAYSLRQQRRLRGLGNKKGR